MPEQSRNPATPDRAAALRQYRRRAAIYDRELRPFEPLRRMAISRLGLQAGEAVLDLGCGTGLSLPLLVDAVGPGGRVIGVEQSPEMISLARHRKTASHWSQVHLHNAPVESARIEGPPADAALFHFTHDILQRPDAVLHVLAHLRPGARIVACGLQWAPPWALLSNLFVLGAAYHSVTTMVGLNQPWRLLAEALTEFEAVSHWMGAIYIARGVWPGPALRHPLPAGQRSA